MAKVVLINGDTFTELLRAYREITERMRIVRRLDFHKPDRVAATYE